MKSKLFVLMLFVLFLFGKIIAQEKQKSVGVFRDSLDQAIDISNFLLNKKGFLIAPSIITEPAVGYGALGAAIYFHSSSLHCLEHLF